MLDDVQARTDIVELIGRYVPLKRSGRHFKALCPFHKERSPSFMVNTDKQIFHCFGCGVGGNVFSFLMQHDRLTFPEAVRQLADHLGVRLPEHDTTPTERAHQRLAPLLEDACRYFERVLLDPVHGQAARAYLQHRGVSDAARQQFRLGLARAGWSHVVSAAQAKGVTPQQLEAAGLAIQGKSGWYDRFRDRLIFPIVDVRGRVVGFGGRGLSPDQQPKYLNSPETELYTKGRHLFGLAQAKEAIAARKTAIIVEGYFDCVVLASAGLAEVVSPLGTALTDEQARLLKRYADRVILAFDPDAAGEQATLRGIDVLVESGLEVSIAQLPVDIDPDEYVQAHGVDRLRAVFGQSIGIFDFLAAIAAKRFPTRTIEGRVNAAQFVLPTVARVPDAMLRSEYVRLLAERLRLDESAVGAELAKVAPRSALTLGRRTRSAAPVASPGAERLLTALVVDDPVRLSMVRQHLAFEDIQDPGLRRILERISQVQAHESLTTTQVVSRLTEEGHGPAVSALVELAQSVDSPSEAMEECVRRLRSTARQRRRTMLQAKIQTAQAAGHEQEVERLLRELQYMLVEDQQVSTG